MQEMQVPSLGWEDPLEEKMATHSSILAWEIPWTEEPGGLQSVGGHKRGGHDLATKQQSPLPEHLLYTSLCVHAHYSILQCSCELSLRIPILQKSSKVCSKNYSAQDQLNLSLINKYALGVECEVVSKEDLPYRKSSPPGTCVHMVCGGAIYFLPLG